MEGSRQNKWPAPREKTRAFYVDAALVRCGHVSGLLMRHGWPLALIKFEGRGDPLFDSSNSSSRRFSSLECCQMQKLSAGKFHFEPPSPYGSNVRFVCITWNIC